MKRISNHYLIRLTILIAAILSIAGCAASKPESHFFPADSVIQSKEKNKVVNPKNTVMIIYTAGSPSNDHYSGCPSNAGVPDVITKLSGKKINGKEILIHGYCSPAAGNLRRGVSMSEARAPDVEKVIKKWQLQGIPPKNIFVAGNSMGGWSAILNGTQKNVEIGGVIAFAPANGVWVKSRRLQQHWDAVERQKTALEGVSSLNSLIYVFEGDDFNSPSDLDFMKNIPRVEYIPIDPEKLENGNCSRAWSHYYYKSKCFQDTQKDKIIDFITRSIK